MSLQNTHHHMRKYENIHPASHTLYLPTPTQLFIFRGGQNPPLKPLLDHYHITKEQIEI